MGSSDELVPLTRNKVEQVKHNNVTSFLIDDAINKSADVFITSDLKYHEYFKSDNKLVLLDIGHYESEQYTKDLIFEFLNKKLINIALHLSKVDTNPVKYY